MLRKVFRLPLAILTKDMSSNEKLYNTVEMQMLILEDFDRYQPKHNVKSVTQFSPTPLAGSGLVCILDITFKLVNWHLCRTRAAIWNFLGTDNKL